MRQRLPLLVALVALVTAPVYAQRTTATIRGSVTDSTKAVIPGATVTVTGEDTGFTRSVTTNAAGLYSFAELPMGSYKVEVGLTGFKSAVRTKVVLNVADDRAVDFELTTGAVTEQVTVEADSLAVKTIGGEVAGLVTGEQVRELPLERPQLPPARHPHARRQRRGRVQHQGPGPDVRHRARGQRQRDAAATCGRWTAPTTTTSAPTARSSSSPRWTPSTSSRSTGTATAPSSAARPARRSTSSPAAAPTSSTAAATTSAATTRSLSKNYFLEQANQPKDKLSVHDFGWTFGGPIVKDKLHFFASQEWNREKRGIVRTAFVPTAAERAGDFSGPVVDGCSSPMPIDPLTGRAFPGNRIPRAG